MTTYLTKLLLAPALFALGVAALVTLVACRLMIGWLTRGSEVETAAD